MEKALDLKAAFELPDDREVGVAVNRGVPVPMSAPRCGVAKAMSEMAETLLRAASSSERRAAPARRKSRAGRRRRTGSPA